MQSSCNAACAASILATGIGRASARHNATESTPEKQIRAFVALHVGDGDRGHVTVFVRALLVLLSSRLATTGMSKRPGQVGRRSPAGRHTSRITEQLPQPRIRLTIVALETSHQDICAIEVVHCDTNAVTICIRDGRGEIGTLGCHLVDHLGIDQ